MFSSEDMVVFVYNYVDAILRSLMSDLLIVVGSDEGIYAWVLANYALGTLGGDSQKTT